ncbi:hypothetical protein J1N35_028657 [Gossypium stocksii]|uniref:Zinc knuckle CX2CX4HX4C domain-containing protein n=1 Tax=Gossypium stocksii TaxID=47602 RepID=A0A9D3ZSS8_9ROSI|nr:hypothetical protein J1N35_028657 [Gossypium stocksii]
MFQPRENSALEDIQRHSSSSSLNSLEDKATKKVRMHNNDVDSILKSIGETIGQVIKLDVNTGNAQRGRFVRMMIFLDLNKPLVSKIKVDGRIQLVEYKSLPNICFPCGHFGHFKDSSSSVPNRVTALGEMNQENSISDEDMKDSDMFRPWMVVNRRNSRLGRKSAIGREERKVMGSMGSHFNILHDLRDGN